MARATWTGQVSFGLVNIPVQMFVAVRDRTVRFHRMAPDGQCRLRTKLYCPETETEYDFGESARGYEVAPDQYVLVKDEEIATLRPESGHTIDIEDFVSLDEIDPIYYDRAYYLAPGKGGERPYRLLVDAMHEARRVGIARFVLRDRQHLAALRVAQGGLCLSTMHWHDEVTRLADVFAVPTGKIDPRQAELAGELVERLSRPFDPGRYVDTFRAELVAMLERKAEGERIPVRSAAPAEPTRVVDLMDALKRSLDRGARAADADADEARPKPKAKRAKPRKGGSRAA